MNVETFSKFSAMHGLVVLVIALATTGLIAHARRLDPGELRRMRRTIGIAALILQVAHNTYWLVFRGGSGNEFPLHVCDVAGLISVAAFLCRPRIYQTLLYFWGIGLSSMAFVIPVLEAGPARVEFWSFWLSHWMIVGGAVFMTLTLGYRPGLRDLLIATAALVVYGIAMIPVNAALGSNYAYVAPESPPAAFLGVWPVPRLPLLGLSAVLLMTAAWAPWAFVPSGHAAASVEGDGR